MGTKIATIVCCLFMGTTLVNKTFAAEFEPDTGLSYNAEEVRMWRQRAASGPYKAAGDAQAYSPGDWARIDSNTKSFRSNPAANRWNGGYQGSGCVPKGTSAEIMGYEPKERGDKLRDAAFRFLLTQDRSLGQLVVSELLRYVNHPLIDFSNRARWCLGDKSVRDANPGFFTAEWVTKMLYAYDYVRSITSPAEQESIERWLLNAALYFQRINDDPTNGLFTDRANGVLKDPTYWATSVAKSHDKGFDIPRLATHYNNRRASIARLVAQVGVMKNHSVLKNSARQFYIDWLKFAVFPDGMMSEYYRGSASSPEKGYHYVVISITLLSELADAFARAGDTSLYDYTTGLGIGATAGGRKDLHLVMTRIGTQIDGSTKRYLPGFPNNPAYTLNGIDPTGREFVHDVWFASANKYFRDPYLRAIYLRKQAGTHAYPAKPANIGYSHPWSSTHATLPGLLFMHGQMEQRVWPFPGSTTPNSSSSTEIAVNATGNVAGGVYPLMRVYANGELIGQTYAAGTRLHRFTARQPQAEVTEVTVQFVNDAVEGGVDRNLFVKDVKIGSSANIVPNAGNSSYDRGDLDGQNVVPGRQMMAWGGFLIINR